MSNYVGIYHRVDGALGYQNRDGSITVILKHPKGLLENLSLLYDDPYAWSPVKGVYQWNCAFEAKSLSSESDNTYIYTRFVLKNKEQRYRYFFKFTIEGEEFVYGEGGFRKFCKDSLTDYHKFGFSWHNSSIGKFIAPPEWWINTNWYQIFPDRFNNQSGKLRKGSKEHELSGGNIKGIIDKLDYIKNMGFHGIYLNPIFMATSYHKYDTTDYFKIDPVFGSQEDFDRLISEMNRRNMKLMLDGVFNHTGWKHPFWQDVLRNKSLSKYKDFYTIWDINNVDKVDESGWKFLGQKTYETFSNTPTMPRINWSNEGASNYIIEVVKHWNAKGIHAWRMDVADEVSFDMWRKIKWETNKHNREIALLGEIWYDSLPFLHGDQFDSSMNYSFRENIIKLLNEENFTVDDYVKNHVRTKYLYSKPIRNGLFNLIGSHDTDRISSVLKTEPKIKMAIAILLLSEGVVSWYYGDEMLFKNDAKLWNRVNMNWDGKNQIEFIRKLMNIRNNNAQLFNSYSITSSKGEVLQTLFENNSSIEFDLRRNTIRIFGEEIVL